MNPSNRVGTALTRIAREESINEASARLRKRDAALAKKEPAYPPPSSTPANLRGIPAIGKESYGHSPGTRPDQAPIYSRNRYGKVRPYSDEPYDFDRNDMSPSGKLAADFG